MYRCESWTKEINPEYFLEGLLLKLKLQYFGYLMWRLIRKDSDPGKDWGQEVKRVTEDEMVGWHHWLNGHEFEQTSWDSDGQSSTGVLQSQDLATEQQQSDQLTSRITGGLAPSSFLTFSTPSPNPESASTCWTQGRSPGSRSPSAISQSESQPSVSQAVGSVPGWVLHHTALRNAVGSKGVQNTGLEDQAGLWWVAHCGHIDLHCQGLQWFLEAHSHPASLPIVGGRRRLGRGGNPRPPHLRSQHLPGACPGAWLLSFLLPLLCYLSSNTVAPSPWYVCSSSEEVLTKFPWASPTKILIPGTWWDPWAHIYNKPTAPQRSTLSVTLERTPSKDGRALGQLLLSALQTSQGHEKTSPGPACVGEGCEIMWSPIGEQSRISQHACLLSRCSCVGLCVTLSRECMFLGSLSRHNKDLEQRTLRPSTRHSSRVLDKPCYSS